VVLITVLLFKLFVMAGAQGDPLKWTLPGWRIEQAYSNKTLIGNWVEERQRVSFMLLFVYAIMHQFICCCIFNKFGSLSKMHYYIFKGDFTPASST